MFIIANDGDFTPVPVAIEADNSEAGESDKQVTLLSLILFIPNSCPGHPSPHLPASVGKE
jgi:hypothetical protein